MISNEFMSYPHIIYAFFDTVNSAWREAAEMDSMCSHDVRIFKHLIYFIQLCSEKSNTRSTTSTTRFDPILPWLKGEP